MGSTLEAMKKFMERVAEDPEGQQVLSFLNRTFLFRLDDGESFIMRMKDKAITFEEGGIKDPDIVYDVTLIETDRSTLMALIEGKIRPLEFYFSGKVYMSGMSAAKMSNNALIRLWRRCQELHSLPFYSGQR